MSLSNYDWSESGHKLFRLFKNVGVDQYTCWFFHCHGSILVKSWFFSCQIFQREHQHIFTHHAIVPHWHDSGRWNHSSCQTRTYLFYIVSIMAADANMMFIMLNQLNLVPKHQGLSRSGYVSFHHDIILSSPLDGGWPYQIIYNWIEIVEMETYIWPPGLDTKTSQNKGKWQKSLFSK